MSSTLVLAFALLILQQFVNAQTLIAIPSSKIDSYLLNCSVTDKAGVEQRLRNAESRAKGIETVLTITLIVLTGDEGGKAEQEAIPAMLNKARTGAKLLEYWYKFQSWMIGRSNATEFNVCEPAIDKIVVAPDTFPHLQGIWTGKGDRTLCGQPDSTKSIELRIFDYGKQVSPQSYEAFEAPRQNTIGIVFGALTTTGTTEFSDFGKFVGLFSAGSKQLHKRPDIDSVTECGSAFGGPRQSFHIISDYRPAVDVCPRTDYQFELAAKRQVKGYYQALSGRFWRVTGACTGPGAHVEQISVDLIRQ